MFLFLIAFIFVCFNFNYGLSENSTEICERYLRDRDCDCGTKFISIDDDSMTEITGDNAALHCHTGCKNTTCSRIKFLISSPEGKNIQAEIEAQHGDFNVYALPDGCKHHGPMIVQLWNYARSDWGPFNKTYNSLSNHMMIRIRFYHHHRHNTIQDAGYHFKMRLSTQGETDCYNEGVLLNTTSSGSKCYCPHPYHGPKCGQKDRDYYPSSSC